MKSNQFLVVPLNKFYDKDPGTGFLRLSLPESIQDSQT